MKLDTQLRGKAREKRLEALSILLCNDLELLSFILNEDRDDLCMSESEILDESSSFLYHQQLLIQTAMWMWSRTGQIPVNAILATFDESRFESFAMAMLLIRKK